MIGSYVCAENAAASPLVANRGELLSWETFNVNTYFCGGICPQSAVNNNYLKLNTDTTLTANSTDAFDAALRVELE